jgi:hypothetical protein
MLDIFVAAIIVARTNDTKSVSLLRKIEGSKWAGLAVTVIMVIFLEGCRLNELSWSDGRPEEG